MRQIALLRGINVGGSTMMKMEELRKTFESLGFENVRTYINSGNLAFDADADVLNEDKPTSLHLETELVSKIEAAVEKNFGRKVPVMVRAQDDIPRILACNPFAGQFGSHKEMHVLFLQEEMSREKVDGLLEAAKPPERFEIKGREIYCHLPLGVADSLLGKGFLEKKLKVSATGRNWRTVEKLAEL